MEIDLANQAVAFLKKLSIFKENKDEMRQCNIAQALMPFIPAPSQDMTMATLRLILNLSFDTAMRTQVVKDGIIPKLVKLLKVAAMRHLSLKVLYHISMDDKCKSMFTYTDCIPMVVNMVQNFPDKFVEKTLIALAINLAANSRNAEAMAAGENLNGFLNRLFQSKDPLLAKMLRNLSQVFFPPSCPPPSHPPFQHALQHDRAVSCAWLSSRWIFFFRIFPFLESARARSLSVPQ